MRTPSVRVWSLAAVAALAACGERPPPSRSPRVPAVVDAGPDAPPPPPPLPAAEAPRVAPHPGQITAVVVERTGAAAVTIDHLGDVRLWPALDGALPPVALPFHGALALDVARVDGRLTVGTIDPSGAAHLYRFSGVGGLIDVTDLPAVPQAVGLVAVADGWLVVRADQSIIRVGADGVAGPPLERDGHRIEALTRSASGAAYALLSRGSADQRVAVVVAVVLGRDGLRWGREVPLPAPPAVPARLTISPDDKVAAYLVAPDAPIAVAPNTGRAASIQLDFEAPVPEPSRQARVRVVALAGGSRTPAALVDRVFDDPRALLFLARDRLGVFAASGDVVVTLGATPAIADASRQLGVAPSTGGGLLVWPAANALAVARGDDEPRFLGFQSAGAQAVAISLDGRQVLWAAGPHRLVVEELAGTAAPRIVPLDGVATALAYLDATHVLVAMAAGELRLVDLARGQAVAAIALPAGARALRYHPGTGWAVGTLAAGGAWAVRIAPGSPPTLGAPALVADASHQAWPLDAASATDPVLVTVESGYQVRTYRADQLAPGPVAATTPTASIAMVGLITPDGTRLDREGAVIPRRPLAARAPDPSAPTPGARRRPPSDPQAPRPFRANAERLLALPGTDDLVVIGPSAGVSRRSRDGTIAWTATFIGMPVESAVSVDGRLLALASPLGGLVLEVATGEVRALRCGWAYGAWPTPPEAAMTSIHSMCE